jgi:hypothetical protein
VTPNFDEMVGSELTTEERDRLHRVHELLVLAGPPPELPPQLEHAPHLGNVRVLRRPNMSRRALLLVAAALLAVGVFGSGYALGHGSGHIAAPAARVLRLSGTAIDPQAQALLSVQSPSAGNWPMTLTVANLPKLPRRAYYEVYLVRNGKPWGSCGQFVVTNTSGAITVKLNAPYALRKGDTWVVTREMPGEHGPGQKVLTPSGSTV